MKTSFKQVDLVCRILFFVLFILCCNTGMAQNVGINSTGSLPDNSAMLDVTSANKGLLIPRVALVSPSSPIPSPANSLLVFNTSTSGSYPVPGFYYFDGTDWVMLGGGGSPAPVSKTHTAMQTAIVNVTVDASTAPTATLISKTFVPTHDTVIAVFNAAGWITASTAATTPAHPFIFRMLVNGTAIKQAPGFAQRNTGSLADRGRMNVTMSLPVKVNPGVANTISISILTLFTAAGSVTLTFDPTTLSNYSSLVIYDMPTN